MTNKVKNPDGSLKKQDFNTDGEDLEFTNFVKFEVLPRKIQYVVDFNNILAKHME